MDKSMQGVNSPVIHVSALQNSSIFCRVRALFSVGTFSQNIHLYESRKQSQLDEVVQLSVIFIRKISVIFLSTLCALTLVISFALFSSVLVSSGSLANANPGDTTAENTDRCPFISNPPPAVDASEVPKSGIAAPAPLPVQNPPIGGYQLGACGVISPVGTPPLPHDMTATSWLLADLDSGKVLAAKDPHGRYRPASTIKLLLAYTVMQHLPLTMLVHGIASDSLVEGDHLGLIAQGNYTVETLLEGLLLISGNDAAVALARALGGEKRTLELMNDNAKKLWALDTRAASVSGLDAPGMSISPYDEALILRAVLKNPDLRRILQMHSAFFHSDKDATGHTIMAQNSYVAYDRGGIGGKTGYTDDAEKTYVGAVHRDGRNMIVVQMYGFSVGADSYWHQSDELLNWGAHIPRNLSIGELVTPTVNSYPLWKPISVDPVTHMIVSGTNNYQWLSWIVLLTCALALILIAYVWKNIRESHASHSLSSSKNSLREGRLTLADSLRDKEHNPRKFYPEKAARTEQELYFRSKIPQQRENAMVSNYDRRTEQGIKQTSTMSHSRSRASDDSSNRDVAYNRNSDMKQSSSSRGKNNSMGGDNKISDLRSAANRRPAGTNSIGSNPARRTTPKTNRNPSRVSGRPEPLRTQGFSTDDRESAFDPRYPTYGYERRNRASSQTPRNQGNQVSYGSQSDDSSDRRYSARRYGQPAPNARQKGK